MEEGSKEAFCTLLWLTNGGRLTSSGNLDPKTLARGNCASPYDCFQCDVMRAEMARHPPGHAIWICPDCVRDAVVEAKQRNLPYLLPGHFTEGQCQYKDCARPARHEEGIELPPGYSRLLQLFIGPVNL